MASAAVDQYQGGSDGQMHIFKDTVREKTPVSEVSNTFTDTYQKNFEEVLPTVSHNSNSRIFPKPFCAK